MTGGVRGQGSRLSASTWGRAQDGEVTAIEGSDALDAQALSEGNDRSIGPTEAEVGVLLDQVRDPREIGFVQLGQSETAASEGAQERCLGAGAAPRAEHVADLRYDGGRDEQLGGRDRAC
jgi:hypothetical protein